MRMEKSQSSIPQDESLITALLVAMVETVGGTAAVPKSIIENMDFNGKQLVVTAEEDRLLISIVEEE